MGLYKRRKLWWINVTIQGKQIRRSTETTDRKLAEAIYSKVHVQIIEGKYFEQNKERPHTVSALLERYDREHIPKKASQRALKGYLKNLRPFFGAYRLDEVTPKMIVQYKARRYQDGVKPATMNRELALMKHAYNIAIKEWEWATDNPVSRVSFERENNRRDRWLRPEEEARLLPVCPFWVREIVLLALNTGMRMGELLSLRWDAVDLFRRTVLISQSKNGDKRTIPLNAKALTLLKEKLKHQTSSTEWIFPSQVGTKRDGHGLRRAFRKALGKAQIHDLHFHDLRHTFATRLVQAGVDLYQVQTLLGHRSPVMTQRYAHHSSESLREGVNVLDRAGLAQIYHTQESMLGVGEVSP